jgi:hypothetical protein
MSSDFDINLAMFHPVPIRTNHPVSDYVNPKFAVEGTRQITRDKAVRKQSKVKASWHP